MGNRKSKVGFQILVHTFIKAQESNIGTPEIKFEKIEYGRVFAQFIFTDWTTDLLNSCLLPYYPTKMICAKSREYLS